LVVAVEQRQDSWPGAWAILSDELERFEYAISPSGAISYSAPAGFHDDGVIALALAASVRNPSGHAGLMVSIAPRQHRFILADCSCPLR
jgi:hypothetical protein